MSEQPRRIQRRRTKGWCTPDNTVIVTRPSRFGNPFTIAMAIELGYARTTEDARQVCVFMFQNWLRGHRSWWMSSRGDTARQRILDGLPELRGRNLACYCPLPEPGQTDHCHAAVLLQLANPTTEDAR
jgi:hypothetical protein